MAAPYVIPRPRPRNNLAGQRVGRLTVLRWLGSSRWFCRCDCGKSTEVQTRHLAKQKIRSCGCLKRDLSSSKLSDKLDGRVFGRLTVLRRVGSDKRHNAVWLCLCECGKEHRTISHRLTTGNVRSCGCLFLDAVSTHGMSRTREYRSWMKMRRRCSNLKDDNYKNYGGRGIKVCDRWLDSFDAFYADMGPRPRGTSLDRINNNGNYEPANCRWATSKAQLNNTRRCKVVEIDGQEMSLTDAIALLRRRARWRDGRV